MRGATYVAPAALVTGVNLTPVTVTGCNNVTGAPEGRPGRNTLMPRFHAQCEEPYALRIHRRRLGSSPQGILS